MKINLTEESLTTSFNPSNISILDSTNPYSNKFQKWQFKKLPPSSTLDNMLRCILLCNDANKLKDKLLSPS